MNDAVTSLDALKAILGDIDDDKAIAIINLQPTVEELEQAASWLTGDGDILEKEGHQLTSRVAAIMDILDADDEENPPRRS